MVKSWTNTVASTPDMKGSVFGGDSDYLWPNAVGFGNMNFPYVLLMKKVTSALFAENRLQYSQGPQDFFSEYNFQAWKTCFGPEPIG